MLRNFLRPGQRSQNTQASQLPVQQQQASQLPVQQQQASQLPVQQQQVIEPAATQLRASTEKYQRRVLGINMPEAINRHHFLNKLKKEWKAIRSDKNYRPDKFPRAMFSNELKDDPTRLVTAHKQGVPLTLLALANRDLLHAILRDDQGFTRQCQELNLTSKLKALPAEIGNLPHLKRLDLTSNGLQNLRPEIGNLGDLEKLHLSGNQLSALPSEMGNLKKVTTLGLGSNNFTDVPSVLAKMTQLKELSLPFNEITTVPDSIGTLTGLKKLHLRGNKITDVFKGIRNLKQLETLDLAFNELATVSDDIGSLTGLKTLHLRANQISTLPEAIGNLTQLQWTDLASNKLTELPPEFGNLRQLRWVDLASNKLTELPPEFGNLKQLEGLNLQYNQLTTWPEGLGSFPNLRRLDLSGNRLTEVSDALLHCGAEEIDLQGNPLSPQAIADAIRRVDALRQQGRAAPKLLLPHDFKPEQIDRLQDTHNQDLQKFHESQFDYLLAQFPDNLRGSMDQQREEIRATQSRLTEALETYATDHPDIDAAREVAKSMFDQSLGLREAYANDFAHANGFKYSPGRVLSFVMMHVERVRDNAPANQKEKVFSIGINCLATQLAEAQEDGLTYCDARQIEDVLKVVAMFNEKGTTIDYTPSRQEIQAIIFDKAKKTLPQFLVQHPHLRDKDEHDNDEKLKEAFCEHMTQIIPAEHKKISAKDTMDYLKENLLPFWEDFKDNALDTEEKPAAT